MSDFVGRLLGWGDASPIQPIVPSWFERTSASAEESLPAGALTEADPSGTAAARRGQAVVQLPSPAQVGNLSPGPEPVATPVAAPGPASASQAPSSPVPGATPVTTAGSTPVSQEPSNLVRRQPPATTPGLASGRRVPSSPMYVETPFTTQAEAETPISWDLPTELVANQSHVPVAHAQLPTPRTLESPPTHTGLVHAGVESMEPAEMTPLRPAAIPTRHPVSAQPAALNWAAEVKRPRAHPVQAVTPRSSPEFPPAVSTPTRSRRAQAEPTVHITIGRVEVKATPAPATPKRTQKANQPVLSLNDYLRDRAGGDHR